MYGGREFSNFYICCQIHCKIEGKGLDFSAVKKFEFWDNSGLNCVIGIAHLHVFLNVC